MGAWSQEASQLGRPVHEIEPDPGYTSVFAWDASTIGVLNPTASEALLLTETPKGWTGRTLQLDKRFRGGGGTAYPDVILRDGGKLYWLSRRGNAVGVFRADGTLLHQFSTGPGHAFSFDVLPDGSVEVFVTEPKRPVAGYRRYGGDGKLISSRAGWLTPLPQGNDLLNTFFFALPRHRVELSAGFPYARIDARQIPLGNCNVLPRKLADRLRGDAEARGTPVPVGRGFAGARQEHPFVFAAAATDRTVYALAAGSVLYEIDAGAARATCRALPPPPGTTRYFHSSIAVNETSIAVLTRYSGRALLRVWRAGQANTTKR